VRLVHGQQFRAKFLDDGLEAGREEPLGRDVEQAFEPALELRDHVALLGLRLRARQQRRVDLLVAELLNLVLHQRDQRRDDDRQPALHDGGQLVAQALARAGGHDAQHVAPAQHVLDHLPLRRAEIVESEMLLQVIAQVRHRRGL
jgi:hypothetical protein